MHDNFYKKENMSKLGWN